jgi:hypothetical protein
MMHHKGRTSSPGRKATRTVAGNLALGKIPPNCVRQGTVTRPYSIKLRDTYWRLLSVEGPGRYSVLAAVAVAPPPRYHWPMPTPRCFPPPWSIEESSACFIVRDGDKQALAYVYYENEPERRSSANLLTRDEAFLIAVNIAKLPRLLRDS